MLNFCGFIQVCVFTTNLHLNMAVLNSFLNPLDKKPIAADLG